MQVAENNYGKHCHLCPYCTKDPIVKSYFRFFIKFLTSLSQSFGQLYTVFSCYRIHKLTYARLSEEHMNAVEMRMINLYNVKGGRGGKVFHQFSLISQ